MNLYSTLLHNGRIQQKYVKKMNRNTDLYKVVGHIDFCQNRLVRIRDQLRRSKVEWVVPIVESRNADANCPRPIFSVQLDQTDFPLHPSGAEETEIGLHEDIWSSHMQHHRLWIFS